MSRMTSSMRERGNMELGRTPGLAAKALRCICGFFGVAVVAAAVLLVDVGVVSAATQHKDTKDGDCLGEGRDCSDGGSDAEAAEHLVTIEVEPYTFRFSKRVVLQDIGDSDFGEFMVYWPGFRPWSEEGDDRKLVDVLMWANYTEKSSPIVERVESIKERLVRYDGGVVQESRYSCLDTVKGDSEQLFFLGQRCGDDDFGREFFVLCRLNKEEMTPWRECSARLIYQESIGLEVQFSRDQLNSWGDLLESVVGYVDGARVKE